MAFKGGMEGTGAADPNSSEHDELRRLREENAELRGALRDARELIQVAPAFFGFLGLDGRVLGQNELALHIIEAKPEDVLGVLFWEAPWWRSLPGSARRVRQAVEEAIRGSASRFDLPYTAIQGGKPLTRWVELGVAPVRDEQGRITRVSATGVDITERREAQDALRASQEQLSRAVQVSQIGFFDWDIPADRLVYSDQMMRDWGLPGAGPLGEALARVHPDDRARVASEVERALTDSRPFFSEYRVVRPGGQVIWVEAQGVVERSPAGVAVRFFGTSRDITERKRIEQGLRAEKHKFEAIFVGSEAAIALLRGPEFVFEKVNRKYRELMAGRPLEEKSLLEALPELVGQPFHDLMKRVFATGEPFVAREMMAKLVRTPGGQPEDTIFDFTYSRVDDGEGRPYGIYIHAIDITEKVLARRKLEETKERLEQVVHSLEHERDLREQFVSTLSHDLRTPLTSARLSAQIIARKADDTAAVQKHSARISGSIDRADQMIRDLLDTSRIRAGEKLSLKISSLDLARLAGDVLEELGTIHGDRFVLRSPTSLPGHWAGDDVRRIIENLCSNAVKYGSPTAPVTVTLDPRGEEVVLQVHNEGRAIDAQELAKIFMPFRRATTAEGQKGWGLGLTLVRGIAEAHGGRVSVSSSEAAGTTFEIVLPLDSRRVESAAGYFGP